MRARGGESIRPGSPPFWVLISEHLAEISDVLTIVQDEVDQEIVVTDSETRKCVVCEGPVFKRHKKGRWPIYCENCSLSDR